MGKLDSFVELVKEFQSVADFVTIYIREAHANDGWSFSKNEYDIKQHTSLAERLMAAEVLAETDHPCPIYVDDITDQAKIDYGSVPDRLFVIKGTTIDYAGARGPEGYNLEELREYLEQYTRGKKNN